MQKIKLFCLPHAGGTAAAYNRWKEFLHENIALCPIELNGRGKLYGKQPYSNFRSMINDVYNQIVQLSEQTDAILFGHSLGALIVYEVCRKMMNERHKMPLHMFISGIRPPHHSYEAECLLSNLPDNEFVAELQKLGGMRQEVTANEELLNFFIPIIRSDFVLLGTYSYVPSKTKLNCDLSVLYGSEEQDKHKIGEWDLYTSQKYSINEFQGNHFFIFEHDNAIVDMINSVVKTDQ